MNSIGKTAEAAGKPAASVVFTIYYHVLIADGRRYVGQTKKTILQRWNQHVYTANGNSKGWSHFANAIRKYGKDAFSHEALEVCHDLDSANEAEKRWIAHFDTTNPERGFNFKKGGDHRPHPVKNPWDRPEYRERAVQASRDRWKDPEFQSKVSASVKEAWKDPAYRALLTASSREVNSRVEVKANISASLRTGKSSRFRGVCWHKGAGKWFAYFRRDGKMVNLGLHVDETAAARAYDAAALSAFGQLATLNFPVHQSATRSLSTS